MRKIANCLASTNKLPISHPPILHSSISPLVSPLLTHLSWSHFHLTCGFLSLVLSFLIWLFGSFRFWYFGWITHFTFGLPILHLAFYMALVFYLASPYQFERECWNMAWGIDNNVKDNCQMFVMTAVTLIFVSFLRRHEYFLFGRDRPVFTCTGRKRFCIVFCPQ